LIIIILCCAGYIGYRYQTYLMFWKYTQNKLGQSLENIKTLQNKGQKRRELLGLAKICEEYLNEKQTSTDAFNLAGRVHYNLGQLYLEYPFTDLIIYNKLDKINDRAKDEFEKAVKNFKKEIALYGNNNINIDRSLKLAASYFYTKYYNLDQIYKIIDPIDRFDPVNQVEEIRFCSLIRILRGDIEQGLDLLKKNDIKSEDQKRQLFFATACKMAGRYTNAILEYKKVLNKTADNNIKKVINYSLGEIYFNQSLHKESLFHFSNALKIDKSDNQLKIWIGKNFSALGYKRKAKVIWSEVLASDRSNTEVKKLLNLM